MSMLVNKQLVLKNYIEKERLHTYGPNEPKRLVWARFAHPRHHFPSCSRYIMSKL